MRRSVGGKSFGGKLAGVTQPAPGGDLTKGTSATSSCVLTPRCQERLRSRAPVAARHDARPEKSRSQSSGEMTRVGAKPTRTGELLHRILEHKARRAKHRSNNSAASQKAAAKHSYASQGGSCRSMKKASVIRVSSVDDLDVRSGSGGKASSGMLMAWLVILVFGKFAQSGSRTVEYASLKDRSVHLSLTEEFTRKHHRLTDVLQEVAESSSWKVDKLARAVVSIPCRAWRMCCVR